MIRLNTIVYTNLNNISISMEEQSIFQTSSFWNTSLDITGKKKANIQEAINCPGLRIAEKGS